MTDFSTHSKNFGISVLISNPPLNNLLTGGFEDITRYLDSYSHTISANTGFDTAKMKLRISREKIDEHAENAVGKSIVVYNEAGAIVWEGFINSLQYSYGGQQTTRGPLLDIANRVSVSYAPLDPSTSPPTVGTQTYTTIVEDALSQEKYGILETIVSGGTLQDADAINIGDLYLQENSWVTTSNALSIGQSSDPEISFDCLGYYHWMEKYVYNSTDAGTVTISDRISDILDFNPNTEMFSTINEIDDNPWLVVAYDTDNKTALTHTKELLAYGDASSNRYTFGCYENRKFKYKTLPTEYVYFMSAEEGGESVTTNNNSVINLWDVRPGNWLLITDMLIGNVPTFTPLKKDPRAIFIEKVDYTMPYDLKINGERLSSFKQRLQEFAGIGSF